MNDSILEDARILYDFHSMAPTTETADFVLAAGSHDLRVADHAANLINEGKSSLLVCSGGFGKVTSTIWHLPEGEVFARRCRELGVPEDSIVVEDRASNSGENFAFSREKLASLGVHPRSGIITSKPYMARRALATARKQWPEVTWYVSPPPIDFADYPNDDVPLDRMINLMVGDLQRLKVYADQGFQVPVDVPRSVWNSYDRLVAAGFNEFVL